MTELLEELQKAIDEYKTILFENPHNKEKLEKAARKIFKIYKKIKEILPLNENNKGD